MRQRALLRKLKRIEADSSYAPLNWLYNSNTTSRNDANRTKFLVCNAGELFSLLPDIIEYVSQTRRGKTK